MLTRLLLLFLFSLPATADIYKWVDEDGQIHYGDASNKPAAADKVDVGSVNSAVAPPPAVTPEADSGAGQSQPHQPAMTATRWASEHCTVRVRLLYTERPFIPCVATDETPVYVCDHPAPAKFQHWFGRRYRYEDRESECGPEVYEGEILYLKR
jgi:hypothetical protein